VSIKNGEKDKKISQNSDSALMCSEESAIIENKKEEKAEGLRKLVVICASTGGPKALHKVLFYLPNNLNAPVLIVQHMPKGFTASLADRLGKKCGLDVKEAEDGDKLENGKIYVAKGGMHMKLERFRTTYKISLSDEPPKNGLKPCADILFGSLEDVKVGEVVCVVLTGMGSDGTAGIVSLGEKKKVYVIAQDEQTSSVFGMPSSIIKTGMADEVLPLGKIPDAIIKAVGTF